MTKENREKLYAHYVEVGYTEAAEDLLAKHPELSSNSKSKKEKSSGKRSA